MGGTKSPSQVSPEKGQVEKGLRWQGLWYHVADCACCSFLAVPKAGRGKCCLGWVMSEWGRRVSELMFEKHF